MEDMLREDSTVICLETCRDKFAALILREEIQTCYKGFLMFSVLAKATKYWVWKNVKTQP